MATLTCSDPSRSADFQPPASAARSGWRPEIETVIAGQGVGLHKKGDSQTFVQIEDGRGRLEVAFFSETATEYAHLLTRDRILVIQGGLREDAFSGGFALKAARCWDCNQICTQHAKRLSLRLDLRVPGIWNRVDELLAKHRPGSTPIRVDLIRPGAAGMLDLNGSHSVRLDVELPGMLRAVPGVKAVKVTLGRRWGT